MIAQILILCNGIPAYNYHVQSGLALDENTTLRGGFIEALVNFSLEVDEAGLKDFTLGEDYYKVQKVGEFVLSVRSKNIQITKGEEDTITTILSVLRNTTPTILNKLEETAITQIDKILNYYSNTQQRVLAKSSVYLIEAKMGNEVKIIYEYTEQEAQEFDRAVIEEDFKEFSSIKSDNVKDYGVFYLTRKREMSLVFLLGRSGDVSYYFLRPLETFDMVQSYFQLEYLFQRGKQLFSEMSKHLDDLNRWIEDNKGQIDKYILEWYKIEYRDLDLISSIGDYSDKISIKDFDRILGKTLEDMYEAILKKQPLFIVGEPYELDFVERVIRSIFPQLWISIGKIRPLCNIHILPRTLASQISPEAVIIDLNTKRSNKPGSQRHIRDFVNDLRKKDVYSVEEILTTYTTWFVNKVFGYLSLPLDDKKQLEQLISPDDRNMIPLIKTAIDELQIIYTEAEDWHAF